MGVLEGVSLNSPDFGMPLSAIELQNTEPEETHGPSSTAFISDARQQARAASGRKFDHCVGPRRLRKRRHGR
jgi:hypothetical protein